MSKKNIFTKSIGVLLSLTLILGLSISGYKDVDATELKPDVTMATEYSKVLKLKENYPNYSALIDFDEETNHARLSLKAIDSRYRRRNKRVYYKNPRRLIVETPNGFTPLAKAMEKWLKQGITEEN